jgi:chromosome segregation ATPase
VLRHPPLKYDRGVITHKSFPDGVNLARADSRDAQELAAFLSVRCDIAHRALPPVVQSARTLLKDPLVRAHNTLRTIRQKINDLRKSNAGLTLQTRQVANRLVRISKTGKDVDTDRSSDKSDVIVHQQKLQKALGRVYNLREANDAASVENAELQARVGITNEPILTTERRCSPRLEEVQRRVAELTARLEQSEEERETAMAQRRVSLSRMSAAIQKAREEIERLRVRIGDVDNRLRIMTQGQKGGDGLKAAQTRKQTGSRMVVHCPDP